MLAFHEPPPVGFGIPQNDIEQNKLQACSRACSALVYSRLTNPHVQQPRVEHVNDTSNQPTTSQESLHVIGKVPDATRDGVMDQHSNDQKSFAMKSPHLVQIARLVSQPRAAQHICNLHKPRCKAIWRSTRKLQHMHTAWRRDASLSCLKLCAIYDIGTN